MLSYGRLTIDFGIVVFAKTRWLFSYGVTFLPDSRGGMLFYLAFSVKLGLLCMPHPPKDGGASHLSGRSILTEYRRKRSIALWIHLLGDPSHFQFLYNENYVSV